MKKILIITFSLCLLLFTNTIYADETYIEGFFQYQIVHSENGEYIQIISYGGDEKEVSIPWTISNREVKVINQDAFANSSVESVIMPSNGITNENGEKSFEGISVNTYELLDNNQTVPKNKENEDSSSDNNNDSSKDSSAPEENNNIDTKNDNEDIIEEEISFEDVMNDESDDISLIEVSDSDSFEESEADLFKNDSYQIKSQTQSSDIDDSKLSSYLLTISGTLVFSGSVVFFIRKKNKNTNNI